MSNVPKVGVGGRLEATKTEIHRFSRLTQKVLVLVHEHQPCPLKTIAKYGFLDPRSLPVVITRLQELGVVHKTKHGREVRVRICDPVIIAALDSNAYRLGSRCPWPSISRP